MALVLELARQPVYTANMESDDVTVIDGATDSVIALVRAGDHPWSICYNPRDNKVYVANHFGKNVTSSTARPTRSSST